MKKSLSVALLGAALWSPWSAQAQQIQAPQSYLKLGVGQGHYKESGASADKTGASIAFGQSFSPVWGYEIGYMHFGRWSGTETTGTVTDKASLRSEALYAALVGTLPLSDTFSLYGKVGVTVNRTKFNTTSTDTATTPATVTRESDKMTKTRPMAGLGVAYQFTKEWAATAEYQYFDKAADGDLKLQSWTVGLKYNF